MDLNIFQVLNDFLVTWVPVALQIVGGFAVIATATPNKVDDKIIQSIMDLVNFLGANFGKARNS